MDRSRPGRPAQLFVDPELSSPQALRFVYGEIQSKGSSKAWSGELYPFNDFSRLMGFERVWAFEREHVEG